MFIPAVEKENLIHYCVSTHGRQSDRLCCASLITYSAAGARLNQTALMSNEIIYIYIYIYIYFLYKGVILYVMVHVS